MRLLRLVSIGLRGGTASQLGISKMKFSSDKGICSTVLKSPRAYWLFSYKVDNVALCSSLSMSLFRTLIIVEVAFSSKPLLIIAFL